MRIFLITPFSSEFNDISSLIKEAIISLGHTYIRADEILGTGYIINQIQNEIKSADFVIADISTGNANVMYELGMAWALGIPVLPITQRGDHIPFDIASVRTIIYDRNRLNETLIRPIRNFLTHSNFEIFLKKESIEIAKERQEKKTVFISYSHVDLEYLNRLKIHLRPFEKKGVIDFWEDTKIKAGEKWKEKIEWALEKAAIAILLVSADFLASDFIIDNELPPLLKAAEEKGKIILPVILRPCRFTKEVHLSQFQSINDPKKPISKLDDNGKEEVYVEIANYIDDFVK